MLTWNKVVTEVNYYKHTLPSPLIILLIISQVTILIVFKFRPQLPSLHNCLSHIMVNLGYLPKCTNTADSLCLIGYILDQSECFLLLIITIPPN